MSHTRHRAACDANARPARRCNSHSTTPRVARVLTRWAALQAANYTFVRMEGHVFSAATGTAMTPLRLYWSAGRNDHFLVRSRYTMARCVLAFQLGLW